MNYKASSAIYYLVFQRVFSIEMHDSHKIYERKGKYRLVCECKLNCVELVLSAVLAFCILQSPHAWNPAVWEVSWVSINVHKYLYTIKFESYSYMRVWMGFTDK